MLLPGDNYSEQLMFTMEAYKETWVDGRAAQLYGETYRALGQANEISKADAATIKRGKAGNFGDAQEIVEKAFEIVATAKKGTRFARAAAPLILADGPLPFGDVVFAIALGLDFSIAAYNLVTDNE